jgi:hypothetical protein
VSALWPLLPALFGVAVAAYLLWPALVEMAGDLHEVPRRYQPRHNGRLIVKRLRAEEAAYQAALDRVWIGALAEMAARAEYRRAVAWS